jgi:hypothetical protein
MREPLINVAHDILHAPTSHIETKEQLPVGAPNTNPIQYVFRRDEISPVSFHSVTPVYRDEKGGPYGPPNSPLVIEANETDAFADVVRDEHEHVATIEQATQGALRAARIPA